MKDTNKKSLLDRATKNENAVCLKSGAISVKTGKYTGRCPGAKFFVCDSLDKKANLIDWESNQEISSSQFFAMKGKILSYLKGKNPIIQDLRAGCDGKYSLSIKVTTELAWQAMFAQNMFVATSPDFVGLQEWSLYCAPGAHSEPRVMINLQTREILIAGTYYAGEIKKSVFTVLSYLLPQIDVLPMHCSVNMDRDGSKPAVFFGLSGTGKTTLSSDEGRVLIGDDEHGWSFEGLFNFEGGCYAKVINLSESDEPQIWSACQQTGSILENVVIKDGKPDFSDSLYTENTRASYDISKISESSSSGVCAHPDNVIFLTCDAFGVLPPVSKLTRKQAVDHFRMGYTAKVAGTEDGIVEPQATFSHCFGAPFMPMKVDTYADLLEKKVHDHKVDCWLVNTGWSGGGYGVGHRMPIEVSRSIIRRIVSGDLSSKKFLIHNYTKLSIPTQVSNIVDPYIVPEDCWKNLKDYKKSCSNLLSLFEENLNN
tara:strand:- start:5315 stop:6763 length:1449 start_codon:yes stop_codon:yes gene_type:complete